MLDVISMTRDSNAGYVWSYFYFTSWLTPLVVVVADNIISCSAIYSCRSGFLFGVSWKAQHYVVVSSISQLLLVSLWLYQGAESGRKIYAGACSNTLRKSLFCLSNNLQQQFFRTSRAITNLVRSTTTTGYGLSHKKNECISCSSRYYWDPNFTRSDGSCARLSLSSEAQNLLCDIDR
jgi:hypothetical protein